MKHTTIQRVAKTRKSKSTAMRIPELKMAFDGLNSKIAALLKEGLTEKEQVSKVQSIWKSIFHRPVSAQAAEAYLKLKGSTKGRKGKGKTKKAQRGGGLAGAPLDYMTRPGVDGVHGHFPAYQTAGLQAYDSINQRGMFQECGTKDFTASVPASIGSGQVGGGTISDSVGAVTSIHSASPPGVLNDTVTWWQGKPLGASPATYQSALKA